MKEVRKKPAPREICGRNCNPNFVRLFTSGESGIFKEYSGCFCKNIQAMLSFSSGRTEHVE